MRTGEHPAATFAALDQLGHIARHADPTAVHEAIAAAVLTDRAAGRRTAVVAATREQVAELNTAIRDAMIVAGHVDDQSTASTRAGERIGAGDRIATRRNDRDLDVANRETWTVTAVTPDGGLRVRGPAGERLLPAGYVATDVELAYASTAHGAQGLTVDAAHVIVDEHTTAATAYVGLTRGRHANTTHLIADTADDARDQWAAVFARDRADLGPAHAREQASREAGRYAAPRPLADVLAEMREAWLARADAAEQLANLRPALARAGAAAAQLAELGEALADARTRLGTARADYTTARQQLAATEQSIAQATEQTAGQLRAAWNADRPAADAAARRIQAGVGRFGRGRRDLQAAEQQLDAWAERWRPILDRLPDQLARPATLATGWHSAAVTDAIYAHAADTAATAHPEHAEQRQAFDCAHRDYERALNRHAGLDQQAYSARIHGHPDRVATLRDLVTDAEHRHTTAENRLTALAAEPALADHPDPQRLLAPVVEAWRTERHLRRIAEHARRLSASTDRSIGRPEPGHELEYGIDQHIEHRPTIGM
jgi:hypothetical protein